MKRNLCLPLGLSVAMGVMGVMLLTGFSGCAEPGYSNKQSKQPAQDWSSHDSKSDEGHEERKAEMIRYINGKDLKLPEGESIKIDSKKIDAFALDAGQSAISDGPWMQDGTFLYKVENGEYAVRFQIKFRQVEGKYAFFGHKFDDVVKQ